MAEKGVVQWVSAVVYIDKGDAEEAMRQLQELCDPYSVYELKDKFYGILDQLPEDDDEVLWVREDGVWHGQDSALVKDKMALLAEHGHLSEKLLTSRRLDR
ncbi:hypothetical protein [Chroococcidiopsis sp. SAG 2025]|uniref:hypothetical protein n=1 Tax=Chroococcidiopsis sp. SAG 2025 TaxID=171389 RepID=UPI0029370DEA|nr:hypothetical protein [Chroococcidiopsis sp. SAG 2025]